MREFLQFREVLERLPEGFVSGKELRFRCPFGERHKHGVDRNPSAFAMVGRTGCLIVRCRSCNAASQDFFRYVGLTPEAWRPAHRRVQRMQESLVRARVVESYTYCDAEGQVVAIKDRWEPGFHGERKTFTWRRPVPGHDAYASGRDMLKGGIYGPQPNTRLWKQVEPGTVGAVELPPISLGLYRLPQLRNSAIDVPILVVEGERKADRLAKLGFIATSGHAGAGKWQMEWGAEFAFRRVCILPDRDGRDVSMSYGYLCAASCLYFRAAEVRIVELPISELKPDGSGGDIVDWLDRRIEQGKRADMPAVAELCKAAHCYRKVGG